MREQRGITSYLNFDQQFNVFFSKFKLYTKINNYYVFLLIQKQIILHVIYIIYSTFFWEGKNIVKH